MSTIPNLEFEGFVRPYTPAPLQEFASLGDTLRKTYDINRAKQMENDVLFNSIVVNPGDQEIKDKVMQRLQERRESIAKDVATGNLRYELATKKIQEDTVDILSDPALLAARQSYANRRQEEEDERKARLSGVQLRKIS